MSHDDPLKWHSIEALGLPKNILLVLNDQGIENLGDLETHIEEGSLIELQDIGPVRVQNLTDAAATYRKRMGRPRDFKRFIFRALASHFAILIVVFAVLGITTIEPVAKFFGLESRTVFDHDEYKTLIFIAFALIAFDVGRWSSGQAAYSSYLLSARRLRVIIACVATVVAMFSVTKNFEIREGFFKSKESLRIFFLALVFVIIEGGRELFLVRKLGRKRKPKEDAKSSGDQRFGETIKRSVLVKSVSNWYERQSDPVRVAAVTVAGTIMTTLVTKFGDLFVSVL